MKVLSGVRQSGKTTRLLEEAKWKRRCLCGSHYRV